MYVCMSASAAGGVFTKGWLATPHTWLHYVSERRSLGWDDETLPETHSIYPAIGYCVLAIKQIINYDAQKLSITLWSHRSKTTERLRSRWSSFSDADNWRFKKIYLSMYCLVIGGTHVHWNPIVIDVLLRISYQIHIRYYVLINYHVTS